MNIAEKKVRETLNTSGITIGGNAPCDIQVHDPRFYLRVALGGSLALGEAYMDGWWDANQLDVFFATYFKHKNLEEQVSSIVDVVNDVYARVRNLQRSQKAFVVGEEHYDVGNDLYRAMLDTRMAYTCGYWKEATTLDQAQEAKFDLVCRKIGLKKGQSILDIGCGWGCFAKFAAEKYGAHVTGVTVSKEQVDLGMKLCVGLPVELKLQDYRKVEGLYDHVVSIGVMEHIGYKNHATFMDVVRRSLKDDGLALVHTIGNNYSTHSFDPWFDKYIFPNAHIPSIAQLAQAMEGKFVMEDWHNFGADYDKTLMAWHENFIAHWPELQQNKKFTERFKRMWVYYLLFCAGMFRSRKTQLWQIVLSKQGVPGGYTSVR